MGFPDLSIQLTILQLILNIKNITQTQHNKNHAHNIVLPSNMILFQCSLSQQMTVTSFSCISQAISANFLSLASHSQFVANS